MEFAFTEAQQRFRDEVRAFARREVTPALFAEMERGGTEHHAGFHARLAEQGWIGLHWPPAYGGRGLDHLHTTIFYEELEYGFAPIARYRTSVAFVGQSVLAFGSERQKQYFLPRIARGELTGVWMLTEPGAGSDAAALRLRAQPDGEDWILEGEKIFTSGAQDADFGEVERLIAGRDFRRGRGAPTDCQAGTRIGALASFGVESVRRDRRSEAGRRGGRSGARTRVS